MNVRKEIDDFARDEDRKTLHWLFDRYHVKSQWDFVATCKMQRHGKYSYQTNRVWAPTEEGRTLYNVMAKEEV